MAVICCGGGFRLYDRYARDLPGVERLSIYSDASLVYSYVERPENPVEPEAH